VIGVAAGFGCYLAVVRLKRALGYDDSLDAFGVHGIGGIIGAILTGVFAHASFGGVGLAEGVTVSAQLGKQAVGVLTTIVYCGIGTWIILKVVDVIIGLRVVDEDEERTRSRTPRRTGLQPHLTASAGRRPPPAGLRLIHCLHTNDAIVARRFL
jgi:ammonia channel protein AmtB